MGQILAKQEDSRSRGVLAAILCAALALATIAVYARTFRFDFVNCDDNQYVYENEHVTGGLTGENVHWALTASHSANWHPITWLSHQLDCQLYGPQAAGHHVTNVLLHAAAAVALLLVLWQMTGAIWPSAFVAAVFALHPLHVESVAWIAERKDVLSGLFFMLTLGAYTAYARRPFSVLRYLLVLAALALGLMAKPMLVTLPAVLVLLDYWPLRRAWSWRIVWEKIPMAAMVAGSCAMTIWAQGQVAAFKTANELPFGWRAANAVVSYVIYLGQMVWPVNMAAFYPHPVRNLPRWEIQASVCILVTITVVAALLVRRHGYLLVGWLWYLGMLVPVIGLVQVGAQARADRYTYLPQIGIYVMIAWGIAELCRGNVVDRWTSGAAAVAVLAAMSAVTWVQAGYWRNSETLWAHAVACIEKNDFAHNNLAVYLANHDRLDEAIEHLRAAVDANPSYVTAYNNLCVDLYRKALAEPDPQQRRALIDEAVASGEQAVGLNPKYVEAHNYLGAALFAQGSVNQAIAQFVESLSISPGDAIAHNNLGAVLARLGRTAEAIEHYRAALEANPKYLDAHVNMALSMQHLGQRAEAIEHYQRALEIDPHHAQARRNLMMLQP